MRSQTATPASYLSRIDKLTLPSKIWNDYFFYPIVKHSMLATLVLDGWNTFFPSVDGLRGFAEIARKKQMGLLVTMRGDLDELLKSAPWISIPYFMYITKQKHKQHRIRLWQNSPTSQIYDRVVEFKGYFIEFRSKKKEKQASKPRLLTVYGAPPSTRD